MVRKPVVRIVLVLSLLTVAGIVALAAAGHHGVVTSQDGRMTIATHGPSHITPSSDSDGSLTVIAGNLSRYPNGVYFCCYGFTISGPTSVIGSTNWVAVPFTPNANYNVKKVKVAVGWVTGNNGVTVSLNEDAGGVPGTALKSLNPTGLGTFGGCCVLGIASGPGGVSINQGTQYWVVVSTNDFTSGTWDAWAINSTDMRLSTIAASTGGAWSAFDNLVPGFGVYGTPE